jgi:signal transduction histidine kinase
VRFPHDIAREDRRNRIADARHETDQRIEAVNEAREEVDRMARLVGDLLFLADADTQGSIDRSPVELDEIFAEIVHDARSVSPASARVTGWARDAVASETVKRSSSDIAVPCNHNGTGTIR